MRRLLVTLLMVGVVGLPRTARAVSITGIMIYSTDAAGMPTGFDFERPEVDRGQLWKTETHPHWYGLGVLSGFPPESLQGPLLNAPDFSVAIPLVEGPNDFTLLGEPGPLSETDAYQSFALNLFFDGHSENPGLSVLFARDARRYGTPPEPNTAEILLGMAVTAVSLTAQTAYDDGSVKVSVGAVSFRPPHLFLDVNLVSAHEPVPSVDGTGDWVGVLEVVVEGVGDGAGSGRSQAFGGSGAPAVMPGVRVGRDLSDTGVGGDGGDSSLPELHSAGAGWHAAAATSTHDGKSNTDPVQTPTPPGTESPSVSGTPEAQQSASPTRAITSTPTRKAGAPTPIEQASASPGTETPVARSPQPTIVSPGTTPTP